MLSLEGSGIGVALVPSRSKMQAPAGVEFKGLSDRRDRLDTALAVATHAENERSAALRFRELLQELGARRVRKRP